MSSKNNSNAIVQNFNSHTIFVPCPHGIAVTVGDLMVYDRNNEYCYPLDHEIVGVNSDEETIKDHFLGVASQVKPNFIVDGYPSFPNCFAIGVQTEAVWLANVPLDTYRFGTPMMAVIGNSQSLQKSDEFGKSIAFVVSDYAEPVTQVRVRVIAQRYSPLSNTKIGYNSGIRGPQGFGGNQGYQGIEGPIGVQGFQGYIGKIGDSVNGATGDTGDIGDQGPQGEQGFVGHQGYIGESGDVVQGYQGDIGLQGAPRQQGFRGYQGSQGYAGLSVVGAQGNQGYAGYVGATGSQGFQGNQGVAGLSVVGAQGSQGALGYQGLAGNTGPQGVQGLQGSTGSTGAQGSVGSQGLQGDIGFGGSQGSLGGNTVDPSNNGLRLTLYSGVAVRATPLAVALSGTWSGGGSLVSGNFLAASGYTGSTLYLTPYTTNEISLWQAGSWSTTKLNSGVVSSLALSSLTSGSIYDVYCYDNMGLPQLELGGAWTDDFTRSDALEFTDGVYTKSGSTTRRYIGSFVATSASTTEDSLNRRYVCNQDNKALQPMAFLGPFNQWNWSINTNIGSGSIWRANSGGQLFYLSLDEGTSQFVNFNTDTNAITNPMVAYPVGLSGYHAGNITTNTNRAGIPCVQTGTNGINGINRNRGMTSLINNKYGKNFIYMYGAGNIPNAYSFSMSSMVRT